jgi:predicted Zn-dependent protease with MMP-like domain
MELEPPGIIPPDDDPVLGRHPAVARVESALDAGRDEEALALADEAILKGEGDPLDLQYLAADALLALGRPQEAEARLRTVLAEDASCPMSRCWLAMALFRQCRFKEAWVEVELSMETGRAPTDAHLVRGLLFEREGDYAAADECFSLAHETDPDRFRMPVRMERREFDRQVRLAARKLPRQFRRHLERVPVIVQDVPAIELLKGGEGLDPEILGLFDGTPLPETEGMTEFRPNYIYLFQRNLERIARDHEHLVEEIAITLEHELGHYLGLDEDEVDEMGLG